MGYPEANMDVGMSGRQRVNFSVVIPVFNGSKTLARAIDSVLAQTYPAFEILVIDDGSTDTTAEVARQFAGQIRYIRQDNAGVSSARNHAAAIAKGNWLAFLDADDWYYPNRLKWHADWINRDSKLQLLSGNFDYIHADGSPAKANFDQSPLGKKLAKRADSAYRCYIESSDLAEYVARHIGDTHTLSIQTEIFRNCGGYPTKLRVCEDVHLLIRLLERCDYIGVITAPMAAYFVHADSATRRDPLDAQQQTVKAMQALLGSLNPRKKPIQHGLEQALAFSKLDLCYALIRNKRRTHAIRVQILETLRRPSWLSMRNLGSIIKGACLQHV